MSATVIVVSPDTRSERKLDLHLTVKQLKAKLESATGIPADAQIIRLYGSEDDAAAGTGGATTLEDDKALGFYSLRDWQCLQVSDASGSSLAGQFSDVSQVKKFEISEEEYAKRQDTVLAYKQRNKLGRFGEASDSHPEPSSQAQSSAPAIPLGSRCEVDPAAETGLTRRGAVRFVGPTKFGHGVWIGIEYDEPVGKNDGSVQGERYFTCKPSFGGFVRPEKVRVGDFPPLDLELDEEMEI